MKIPMERHLKAEEENHLRVRYAEEGTTSFISKCIKLDLPHWLICFGGNYYFIFFCQRISKFDTMKILYFFFTLFRYALKRNLHVLTFDVQIPYPNTSFIPFQLDNHHSLHKLSHFDVAADHMIYNKAEFQQVMPKDTVYLSSLREPVAQFKSGVNFFVVIVFISQT